MRSIEFLSQLISFPSVSSDSNVDISRCVEHHLQSLGFETEWLEYTDPNGISKACVSGRRGPAVGRGLAYFCHTDVVPATTWSFSSSGPWEPFEQNERLYGRGSCDMKGSLACALAAAESLKDTKLNAPFSVVCTADEEIGLRGAEQLVKRSDLYRDIVSRQSRGIVGEPTLLNVVHAHKGGRGMKITSHGIAAHSSSDEGRNANIAMIPFLEGVRQLLEEIAGEPDWEDDRFTPPTISLNLGINDNNSAMNITAAQSVCTIYFRVMPTIDADGLVARIRSLAEGCGLEVEMQFATNALFTDPNSRFIGELLGISGGTESRTVAYGTDGSCFTELEDIAVFGPGDIRQAHKDDEWISLEQLARGTELYRSLIEKWCVQAD